MKAILIALILAVFISSCKKSTPDSHVPEAKLPTVTVISINPVTYNSLEVNTKIVCGDNDPCTGSGSGS